MTAPPRWFDARIVGVDDEPVNIRLLERILAKSGFVDVGLVTNPEELLADIANRTPDLVLLDLHMPALDGFGVLERLEQLMPGHAVPVLVLTADASPDVRDRALASGARDFVTKPFNLRELQLRIDNLLTTRRLHLAVTDHAALMTDVAVERTGRAELLAKAIDVVADPMLVVDSATGTVVYANRSLARLLGTDVESLVGAHLEKFSELAEAVLVDEVGPLQRRETTSVTFETEFGDVPHEMSAHVLDLDDGRTMHVFIGRDVTGRRELERSLRVAAERERGAAEQLRVISLLKDDFLESVSHELRTPLTVINGGIELLHVHAATLPDQDRNALLEGMITNARRLKRILDDLLVTGPLVRDEGTIELVPTELAQLVRDVVETIDTDEWSLELGLDDVTATVDPAKLRRVVENLLGNAHQHTPAGTHVHIRLTAQDGSAVIVVSDDGPGVPDESKETVYEPFRRGAQRTHHSPGTGVGLTVVRAFVEMHGGRTWVVDSDTGGAAFHVELPLLHDGPPPTGRRPAQAAGSSRQA